MALESILKRENRMRVWKERERRKTLQKRNMENNKLF
jgi:hypothetical protein